jgi:hypothetical protein
LLGCGGGVPLPDAGVGGSASCDGANPALFCDDCNPCTNDANCTPCSAIPEPHTIYNCTPDEQLAPFCAGSREECAHYPITGGRCFPTQDGDTVGACCDGVCIESACP